MSFKKFMMFGLAVMAVCHCQEAEVVEEEEEIKVEEQQAPKVVDYNTLEGVYFYESFDKDLSRWTLSTDAKYTGNTLNDIKLVEQSDEFENDLSLTLETGARYYGLSANLNKVFNLADASKPLVVQYEVRMKQAHTCGGAYLKLLSQNESEPENAQVLNDKTPFSIMFGPDKCGDNNRVHFIARHQSPVTKFFEEKAVSEPPKMKLDEYTSHLYTLVLEPNSKFAIYIDGKKETSGHLLDSVTPPVTPPKEIDDPSDVKPADWIDDPMMPDPAAEKPADWDVPEYIPDPEATKPEDWDDDMDGDWVPQEILNPEFKGEWSAPMIKNPDYKGPFIPKKIANPEYFEDKNPVEHLAAIRAVAIEIWTMTPQTTFDNILVADNKAVADKVAEDTWKRRFEAQEKARKEEEEKASEQVKKAGSSTFVDKFMDSWGDYLNDLIELTHEKPEISIAVAVAVGLLFPVLIWITCSAGSKKPEEEVSQKDKEEEVKEEKKEEAEEEVSQKDKVEEVKEEKKEEKEVDEIPVAPVKEEAPAKKQAGKKNQKGKKDQKKKKID